jgi:hypothetical protein
MRGRRLVLVLMGLVLLAAAGGRGGTTEAASAAANPESNCAAVLTSFFGPQGAVDDAVHILQQAAAAQGISFGQLARTVAQTEGTLNECLALVGQPPVG